MKRSARRTGDLPLVPLVPAGQSLVAALVVAREASHQLLSPCGQRIGCLNQKLLGLMATQRRRDSTVVQHLDIAVLPTAIAEAEVSWLVC